MRPLSRAIVFSIAMTMLAMPGVAAAHTTGAIAETGGSVTTLPILGTSLQVEIVLDASGNLEQVNLDPTTGVVATELDAHEVEFKFTGTSTEVDVEAHGDALGIKVETSTLADLLGPGDWSADLFGTGMVTVGYEIGQDGGQPTITLGDIVVPDGVTFLVGAESEEDEAEATILFFFDGMVKTLTIEVEADDDDAELEVSLQGPTDDDDLLDDDEVSQDDDEDSEDAEGHDDPTTNVTVVGDDDDSGSDD